jgi:transcription elongation GreA/GreB family factor
MKEIDIKKISKGCEIPENAIRETLARATVNIKTEHKKPSQKEVDRNHFYFLPDDFTLLDKKIETLHQEIDRLGKAIGLSSDISGETFHDNFDYEECSRQQAMWSEEIRKLTIIKRKAKMVSPNESGDIVAVGRTITLENNGKNMTIKIGSYMTFSSESVSYASPIVKLIFGAKSGDTKEGLIQGQKTKIHILEIR